MPIAFIAVTLASCLLVKVHLDQLAEGNLATLEHAGPDHRVARYVGGEPAQRIGEHHQHVGLDALLLDVLEEGDEGRAPTPTYAIFVDLCAVVVEIFRLFERIDT